MDREAGDVRALVRACPRGRAMTGVLNGGEIRERKIPPRGVVVAYASL